MWKGGLATKPGHEGEPRFRQRVVFFASMRATAGSEEANVKHAFTPVALVNASSQSIPHAGRDGQPERDQEEGGATAFPKVSAMRIRSATGG